MPASKDPWAMTDMLESTQELRFLVLRLRLEFSLNDLVRKRASSGQTPRDSEVAIDVALEGYSLAEELNRDECTAIYSFWAGIVYWLSGAERRDGALVHLKAAAEARDLLERNAAGWVDQWLALAQAGDPPTDAEFYQHNYTKLIAQSFGSTSSASSPGFIESDILEV